VQAAVGFHEFRRMGWGWCEESGRCGRCRWIGGETGTKCRRWTKGRDSRSRSSVCWRRTVSNAGRSCRCPCNAILRTDFHRMRSSCLDEEIGWASRHPIEAPESGAAKGSHREAEGRRAKRGRTCRIKKSRCMTSRFKSASLSRNAGHQQGPKRQRLAKASVTNLLASCDKREEWRVQANARSGLQAAQELTR
jgi:hypothetical protein